MTYPDMNALFENKVKSTIGIFILTGLFILIEHFDGGVVSHHLLAREDLPAISNWWGLLTVPLITWIVISLEKKKEKIVLSPNQHIKKNQKRGIRFLSALIFGIAISLLWELVLQHILSYIIIIPFLLSIFKPIHFPESLLGFVIGMIFTFGGILPIIGGLVILIICFIINKLINLLRNIFTKQSI